MGRIARRAFTLIELLLVLVILAVLASVVVPLYVHRVDEVRVQATKAELSHLQTVLGTFELDNNRYPTTEEGLGALLSPPADLAATWHGPYMDRFPADKWGNAYRYLYPGTGDPTTYTLYSCGKDGQDSTEDDIWLNGSVEGAAQ